MFRVLLLPALLPAAILVAPGCVDTPEALAVASADRAVDLAVVREHVTADIFHYTVTLPVGSTPNARLRIHRIVREAAPWRPRPTANAAMLLHGDFATFVTNFAPSLGDPRSPVGGLAPHLAAHDIDVWGVDRRWTIPSAPDADVSDFADMGVVQDTDDIGRALAFARATRAATGSGADRLALVGFSHGAQLAYVYSAVEGARPAAQRHVRAMVALDIYADIAPEDAALRANACANSAFEYDLVAQGVTDSPNDFFIALGALDREAPDDPSPLFDGATNRGALLIVGGTTYNFAPFTPLYHLVAPVLDAAGAPTDLRESSFAAVDAWFSGAPPHESMREAADLDALWCGSSPPPIAAPLSQIHVPVLYLGAAGGFGDHGLFTTTRLGTSDVQALIVHRFGADRVAEDFGHGDLLYATDAPALAWQPLTTWLVHH
jgi:hypothetical protein